MSASSYICPHCGKAVTVKSVPVEGCPFCGAPVPEPLADEIERNFRPARTISLSIQMWIGFILGFIYALAIPAAFGPPDDTLYTLFAELGYDIPAPPHMPPVLTGILCIFQTCLLLYTSYLLYMNDYRSRQWLMILVFVFTVPETVVTAPLLAKNEFGKLMFFSKAITCVLSLLIAYWYLYRWKYCRFYYDSMRYLDERFNRDESE